jgi:hypothetical protein
MEMTDADGAKANPTFYTSPSGDVPVFGRYYRKMEAELQLAVQALEQAAKLVPERCRPGFNAESSSIRWFYHTARAQANFYESCQIRDRLAGEIKSTEAQKLLARWREVLQDERENAAAALPLMQADMRLDWYYGGDHSFHTGKRC